MVTFWDYLRVGLLETQPDLLRVLLSAEDADHVEDAGLALEGNGDAWHSGHAPRPLAPSPWEMR